MEEAALTTLDLESLIRMVFLDRETFSMLLEDGKVEGQIGETRLFSVRPIRGYTTLYRIDIKTMDEKTVDSYVFHKHTSKIPKGIPGKAMELFRINSDASDAELNGVNATESSPRSYGNSSKRTEVDFRRDNPLISVLKM